MAGRIRGKVARILNSREIAINVGRDHGVRPDMCFEIMDQKHQDIEDPDTGALLGSIERPKVRVKIIVVQDRLSLAATYKKKTINVGGSGFGAIPVGLAQALMPPKWVTKYETLKTEEQTWENLDEKESFVKIGDAVVQVFALDEEDEKQEHAHQIDES